MKVDIWSDVVCPWCYLGKRRFQAALDRFPHEVEVRWRSFELDPSASPAPGTRVPEMLRAKYGASDAELDQMFARVSALAAEEGLAYRLPEAYQVNSFDLHRLLHAAAAEGVADEVLERLMRAQHCEAVDLGDRSTQVEVSGLPAAAEVLATDAWTTEVRADEAEARRLGITGVPALVLAGRYLVSGAQSVETFEAALHQASTAS